MTYVLVLGDHLVEQDFCDRAIRLGKLGSTLRAYLLRLSRRLLDAFLFLHLEKLVLILLASNNKLIVVHTGIVEVSGGRREGNDA